MKERKEKETSHEGLRQISRECDDRREKERERDGIINGRET